nr:hypothetical protein [Tanacetum cinerariifolium]
PEALVLYRTLLELVCRSYLLESYVDNLSNDIYGNTYTLYRVITARQAHLVDTNTESEPKEASSEEEESHLLGLREPLMGEEFEASEPSSTRTISSHSSASSDSTTSLLPNHPLTHDSPTPTPTQVSFHHRTTQDESLDSDDEKESHDLDDESHGLNDESHGLDDESHGLDDESRGLDDESHGLDDEGQSLEDEGPDMEEDEATPEGQQQEVLVVDIAVSEPLGLGYGAARRRALELTGEIAPNTYKPTLVTWVDHEDGMVYTDISAYVPPAAPVQTPPSPEWSPASLLVLPSSPVVSSPIASQVATPAATISVDEDQFLEVGVQLEFYESILYEHTQCLDALPPTLFEGYDRDLRELYTRSGVVRD